MPLALPVWLIVLAALAGCSARQQPAQIPGGPNATPQARACNSDCSRQRQACDASCASDYQACLATQEKAARNVYVKQLEKANEELQTYNEKLKSYHRTLKEYRIEKRRLTAAHEKYQDTCEGSRRKKKLYCKYAESLLRSLGKKTAPNEPVRPVSVELADLVDQYQKTCTSACGCSATHQRCSVSCGSRSKRTHACESNCR
jgi:hypothetical protein